MSQEQSFCVNHPNVPTALRCNKCGDPICPRCALSTPVGYRCRNCVKNQQAVFYTALWYDYIIAGVVSLMLSGLAHVAQAFIPFLGVLIVFAGLLVGGGIAEVVRLATGKRRGRYTALVVAVGVVVGALPGLGLALFRQGLYGMLFVGVSMALAVGAASARLRVGR